MINRTALATFGCFECPILKKYNCPFVRKGYRVPCIYLKRFGTYSSKSENKIQRFMCTRTNETFSTHSFDIDKRYLRRNKDIKIENMYTDYLQSYTLRDIADKYNLSLAEVRTRLRRAKEEYKPRA